MRAFTSETHIASDRRLSVRRIKWHYWRANGETAINLCALEGIYAEHHCQHLKAHALCTVRQSPAKGPYGLPGVYTLEAHSISNGDASVPLGARRCDRIMCRGRLIDCQFVPRSVSNFLITGSQASIHNADTVAIGAQKGLSKCLRGHGPVTAFLMHSVNDSVLRRRMCTPVHL